MWLEIEKANLPLARFSSILPSAADDNINEWVITAYSGRVGGGHCVQAGARSSQFAQLLPFPETTQFPPDCALDVSNRAAGRVLSPIRIHIHCLRVNKAKQSSLFYFAPFPRLFGDLHLLLSGP